MTLQESPQAPFDLFLLLAEMRTGSNLLETCLNALPGVTCHGELFNPHFIGHPRQDQALGFDLAQREADPLALIAALRAAPGLNGFRYFHDHDPRILAPLLADARVAKIVLTRNPLDSYVSLQIARQTGQWRLGDARHQRRQQMRFDPVEFESHLQARQEFQRLVLRALQEGGQTGFFLDYDDLNEISVLNGLARFLGQPGGLQALPGGIVKQNPEPLSEKVSNYPEMAAALAGFDRFNLGHSPIFEPRRAPGVPGFLAAARSPLLFQPIKSGPGAAVVDYLTRLDGGAAPQGGFTQKTLRQWLRAHPGHRSFTVLRHPAARAYDAFCRHILSGDYAEIAALLRKQYKLALPDPARLAKNPQALGLAELRAAFLGFARFLVGNLAGQTALRIDGSWASQAAVVQGFAGVLSPDLILREADLARDLPALARAMGCDDPPAWQQAPDVGPHPLAAVMDAEIADTLARAYRRDHVTFGFAPWSPA